MEVKTIVRWWLIAGIIVGGLLLFGILVGIFVCVGKRYNRMLREDAEREKQQQQKNEEVKPAKKPRRYWKKRTTTTPAEALAAADQLSIQILDTKAEKEPLLQPSASSGSSSALSPSFPGRRQIVTPTYGLNGKEQGEEEEEEEEDQQQELKKEV